TVIFLTSASTLRSIDWSAGWRTGLSAASSLDCVAATTPPVAPALSAMAAAPIATPRPLIRISSSRGCSDRPDPSHDRRGLKPGTREDAMTRLVTFVVATVLLCAAPAASAAASPLDDYARTTWASLAAMTDPATGLPADSLDADGTTSVQTSSTNIG